MNLLFYFILFISEMNFLFRRLVSAQRAALELRFDSRDASAKSHFCSMYIHYYNQRLKGQYIGIVKRTDVFFEKVLQETT
jgi:hypothetical protein